jgi:filamentous hemagglutinin family protein
MKSQRRFSEVSVALCFVTLTTQVFANPVGESLRAGRARFDRSAPGSLSIHQQTDKVIINWRDFSIAAAETTRFIQPSATSIALNRVVTANPSRLFGSLEANGKVYLINPNGILVGRGGAVNTRGFVASTLEVSDASFLSSAKLRLSGDSEASVVNEGSIQAIGGDVFLVGRTVENLGSIRAGTVGLGAGSEVMIVPTGRERLSVIAGNRNGGQADKGVNNVGTIEAVSAELMAAGGNIYALAINNGGIVRATGVRREGGRVFLSTDGGDIENSGVIVANNANGGGGFVSLAGGHNDANPSTVVNSGTIEARGDAAGTQGGEVRLTGDYVGLFGASVIDVSGQAGGGTALIGGDYQGANARIQNAQRTFVGEDARIHADALAQGHGGKVVVWSDEITRFAGSISARGGSAGGNGGFAEVSGKTFLLFNGRADLTAANGLAGTILLDPRDATIQDTGADDAFLADSTLAFAEPDTTTDVTISDDAIEALTGNVIIQAHRDLFINEALTLANQTAGETVEFQAGGNLDINATVVTGGATLSFTASDAGGANSATASLTVDAAVGDANTGAISFINDGSGGITIDAAVRTGDITVADAAGAQTETSGGITVNSGGPVTITASGSLTTGSAQLTGADGGDDAVTSGSILITSTGDAVVFNGNLATGNATVGDENGDDTATTGNITISAGTGISGSGQAATGDALISPAGAGSGQNATTSGDISLTAGTGGVSGGIGLSATSALSIGTATGANPPDPGANDEANAGSITLNSFGEINNGTASTPLNLGPIGAASGATINNPGQLVVTTTGAGGNVFVTSASDLSVGAVGTAVSAQTVGLTTSGGANLTIQDAAEALQGDAVTLDSGSGTLTIDDDDYNVGAGSLTLIGSEINLTGNNDGIQGTGALVIQPNTAGGNIELAGADDGSTLDLLATDLAKLADGFSSITIGRSSDGTGTLTVSGASAFNDDLTLVAGALVFDAAVTSAGNAVTLTARTGDITDGNGALANLVAASLSASAQTGLELDTTITTLTLADVLGTGAIDISDTAGGLVVTAATTANGDITLNATGGDLDVASATAGGTGRDVSLTTTTSGDVRVGNVTAAGDTVTITAADSIDELGVADPDADITAATVSLTADTGIGGAGTLEIDATTLSLADVTGTGGIDLLDISGGLAVTTATTADGDITLNAVGGNLAVATATAGGGSSDINLSTTTSGDVQVGNVTAVGDTVTINSAGAIEELGADAGADITADTLSLTAATGIGAAGTLEINATTLSLATVTGIGAIDLSDTAGGLAVTTATTADGDITLNATSGDLTVTTVTASGTGADVQLSTGSTGDVNVGAVTAAGDTVTITSAGAITDGNAGLVNILADSLSATAQDGIDLDTTITTLSLASVLGTGNINIADTDGLIVTSAATTTGGNIILGATSGDLDVVNANAGGTGDIQLTTTTSGNVNIGTVTAAGDDVTITSAGTITDGNAGAANVTADTLTATATSIGISTDAIETSVNSLDLNTSAAGGDQFITEANGLTALNLNAGLGDVALTLTLGAIADTDGATDIIADQATVVLSDATAQGFGSGANRIATSVSDLTVNTAAGGGDQFITEANGLTALNLNAGAGDVDLTLTLGAVADTDGLTDITAGDLIVLLNDAAPQGFGSMGNTIQTSVGTLSVDTSAGDGSQFVTEANGLTGLNLIADGGNVNLTLAAGSLLDSDANPDIDAANVTAGVLGVNAAIGSSANPIEIDASGASVLLTAQGSGGGIHLEVAQADNVRFTDSLSLGPTGVRTLFVREDVIPANSTTFDVRYVSDLTVRANGNISSGMAAGTSLLVPGALTLNAVGAGSSIGGGIANPFAIDAGTLNASAGMGVSFSAAGNLTLGNISTVGGAFFIEAANTLTFNGATVINAGVAGTAILVANGIPGVSVVGTPAMNSRFLLYALNAGLTDPIVILSSLGVPSIGALVADAIDSPRAFNPLTPDPFGDLLDYFIFSLEANPPTDPSLFIDIPVEVFQPVSIVFGEYDPTKFGEVGDLWMSSSELYEIERKAGKARKALPPQVNRAKYTPQGN